MKKILYIIMVAVIFSTALFTGCKKDENEFTFYAPDGAPIMSAVNLFADNNEILEGYSLKTELTTGASIAPLITGKTPDIALAPINVCAQGYTRTDKEYVLAGVAVWGLVHIVTRDESISSLSDLKGETLYAFQKTGTPGLTLKAVLAMFDVPYKELSGADDELANDKVNILYLADPATVRQALTQGLEGKPASDYKHALLAEPAVTATVNSSNGVIKRAFDMQQLWEQKTGASYPQVGLIIRKSIVENHREFADAFVSAITSSSEYAKQNPADASVKLKDVIGSNELPATAVIQGFIEGKGQSALTFAKSEQTAEAVKNYLRELTERAGDLSIVGGALPDDGFYL